MRWPPFRKKKGYVLPRLKFKTSPNRDSRHGEHVDLIVVHDTEGGYAGAVSWLCNPKARASAHIVIREDGREATQIVGWEEKAWACENFNAESDNIELAGFASKPYPQAQLGAAARVVAFRLHQRHIPCLHSKIRGYCYHSDLGVAGGGHHDPGFSPAQKKWFEAQVKYEYDRGGFRDSYGLSFMGV